MANTSIKLRSFTDYRAFLWAYSQDTKRAKPQWSYGVWSKSLGLKTTSSISKILQGVREPGPEITEKLVTYFRFNPREAQYFRDLVRLHKIKKDPRLSVLLMEKMGEEHPDASVRIFDDKSFLVISQWYHLALRELCRMKGFREDPTWISDQMLTKVTPREITQAIKTLIDQGLLRRDERGHLCLAEGRVDTSNDIASEAIKRYHEQTLEHAKAAVRRVAVADREITSTSLVMSSGNLSAAKELIREFRQKFEKLMEEDAGDRVYQLQIQLFPLTEKIISEETLHDQPQL